MTLLELISFCKLNGRVRSHKEVAKAFRRLADYPAVRKYRVIIQSRGYEAIIEYSIYEDGKVKQNYNRLTDFKDMARTRNVSVDDLVSRLLGPDA